MRTYTWTIRWGNPYTRPPAGKPEVLLSVTRQVASSADMPPEIAAVRTIGTGYSIHCRFEGDSDHRPRRRMGEEARQRMRIARLRTRLAKKAPLFAEELLAEELRAKPDYYGRRRPE